MRSRLLKLKKKRKYFYFNKILTYFDSLPRSVYTNLRHRYMKSVYKHYKENNLVNSPGVVNVRPKSLEPRLFCSILDILQEFNSCVIKGCMIIVVHKKQQIPSRLKFMCLKFIKLTISFNLYFNFIQTKNMLQK